MFKQYEEKKVVILLLQHKINMLCINVKQEIDIFKCTKSGFINTLIELGPCNNLIKGYFLTVIYNVLL